MRIFNDEYNYVIVIDNDKIEAFEEENPVYSVPHTSTGIKEFTNYLVELLEEHEDCQSIREYIYDICYHLKVSYSTIQNKRSSENYFSKPPTPTYDSRLLESEIQDYYNRTINQESDNLRKYPIASNDLEIEKANIRAGIIPEDSTPQQKIIERTKEYAKRKGLTFDSSHLSANFIPPAHPTEYEISKHNVVVNPDISKIDYSVFIEAATTKLEQKIRGCMAAEEYLKTIKQEIPNEIKASYNSELF